MRDREKDRLSKLDLKFDHKLLRRNTAIKNSS